MGLFFFSPVLGWIICEDSMVFDGTYNSSFAVYDFVILSYISFFMFFLQ